MASRAAPGLAAVVHALVLWTGCDSQPSGGAEAQASTPAPVASVSQAAAADPPRAPDIVIDASSVSVGHDRVASGELSLADKVAVLLRGRPTIEGNTVHFVAMRNARPSQVVAVVSALRQAKATSAVVSTDARDGTTQDVPLSFASRLSDCVAVAWIAKDAAIEVWPAGGGTARRVIRGLAGPDMTLGTEAMRKQWSGCGASELVVGAEDVLPWGLVFDLATAGLQASGVHPSTAVLVSRPSPGRKLALD